jgi:hypothetical protein
MPNQRQRYERRTDLPANWGRNADNPPPLPATPYERWTRFHDDFGVTTNLGEFERYDRLRRARREEGEWRLRWITRLHNDAEAARARAARRRFGFGLRAAERYNSIYRRRPNGTYPPGWL